MADKAKALPEGDPRVAMFHKIVNWLSSAFPGVGFVILAVTPDSGEQSSISFTSNMGEATGMRVMAEFLGNGDAQYRGVIKAAPKE